MRQAHSSLLLAFRPAIHEITEVTSAMRLFGRELSLLHNLEFGSTETSEEEVINYADSLRESVILSDRDKALYHVSGNYRQFDEGNLVRRRVYNPEKRKEPLPKLSPSSAGLDQR